MSTTTVPASLTLYSTKKAPTVATVCRNPECSLELTVMEKARRATLNGLCETCHEDGVIVSALALPTPTNTSAPVVLHPSMENYVDDAFQHCFECGRCYLTADDLIAAYNREQNDQAAQGEAHTPAVTTADDIYFCPECFHDFLYPPLTGDESPDESQRETAINGDVRRCGHCDTNISALNADARFCSRSCEQETKPAAVPPARPAPGVVEVRFIEPKKFDRTAPEKDIQRGRNSPISVAIDVVMFARPDLTEHQAETGLRAAIDNWAHGKVQAAGVTAAARAWTPTGEDYDDMKHWAQARANTAALRLLKKAIRSAQEYNAALSS